MNASRDYAVSGGGFEEALLHIILVQAGTGMTLIPLYFQTVTICYKTLGN